MIWVMLDAKGFAFQVFINECDRGEILLVVYAAIIAESERSVPCWISDRTPEIDDLVSALRAGIGL
jgi:hypothetical protein